MRSVILEISPPWRRFAGIRETIDPPGSVSSDEPTGRQVYLFGFLGPAAGVWRAIDGFDIEDPFVREIVTSGLEQIADLSVVGVHTMQISRKGYPVLIRFRLEES